MIIKEFQLGNTRILVDDEYMPKTEDERKQRYEIFNRIGCEIIDSTFLKK